MPESGTASTKSVCPACVIEEKRSEFWFGCRRGFKRAFFRTRTASSVLGVPLLCSVLGWLVGWLYATLYMTTMTEITWDFVTVAAGAFQIWLALISVSISVRRLHDVGRNGLWVLPIVFIPVLGAIFWFVLGCLVGEQHENRYGPDPYASRNNLKALTIAS